MKIILDGREDQIKVTQETSLRSLIEEIKTYLGQRSRVVTTFELDGKPLTPADQQAMADRPVGDFAVLAVQTVDPRELSMSILDQFHEVLGRIEEGYQKASEELTTGKVQRSMEWLQRSFESWNVILNGIRDVIRLFTLDADTVLIDGESLSKMVAHLNKTLTSFRRSLSAGDIVAVGDLAAYELKPLIPQWARLMEVLRETVEKKKIT